MDEAQNSLVEIVAKDADVPAYINQNVADAVLRSQIKDWLLNEHDRLAATHPLLTLAILKINPAILAGFSYGSGLPDGAQPDGVVIAVAAKGSVDLKDRTSCGVAFLLRNEDDVFTELMPVNFVKSTSH